MMIGNYKFVIAKNNQKGSILIGIIAAMVLFAAIGTAMLSLTSTATMNQVMANSAARAYYLAESGIRYAKKNGSDPDINKTYKINGGSFKLNVQSTGTTSTGSFGTGDYKSVRKILDPYHYP